MAATKLGVFPGTFDPLTNGHLDVIRRGQALFDRLIVAIGHNPEKQPIFTAQERADMIGELVRAECQPHVEVDTYRGLTVNYARRVGATAILRGLRNVTDLNFEFQLALTNRAIAGIETVFIMTGESYAFTSSSLIRQITAGGQLEGLASLLPAPILNRLRDKVRELGPQGLLRYQIDGFKE